MKKGNNTIIYYYILLRICIRMRICPRIYIIKTIINNNKNEGNKNQINNLYLNLFHQMNSNLIKHSICHISKIHILIYTLIPLLLHRKMTIRIFLLITILKYYILVSYCLYTKNNNSYLFFIRRLFIYVNRISEKKQMTNYWLTVLLIILLSAYIQTVAAKLAKLYLKMVIF